MQEIMLAELVKAGQITQTQADAFNDVHAMMAFVGDNRREAAETLLNANERYVDHANDANVAMSRTIGLPFCRALQDFAEGRYAACVDRLLRLNRNLQ